MTEIIDRINEFIGDDKERQRTIEFLSEHFAVCDEGFLVYKNFGDYHHPPKQWGVKWDSCRALYYIKLGTVITESNVDMDVYRDCSTGINFGTKYWFKFHMKHMKGIYLCLLRWEDLCDVVVPLKHQTKARCGSLEIIDKITLKEIRKMR